MNPIAVVYCSVHHGNTKKLLDGIAEACAIDLLDASQAAQTDLSEYSAVGFASGIYYSKLHNTLLDFLAKNPPLPEKIFFLYTCGSGGRKYADDPSELLKNRGHKVLGVYSCRGYDTCGPFRLVGGIAKGHPTQQEISAGVKFLKEIEKATSRE